MEIQQVLILEDPKESTSQALWEFCETFYGFLWFVEISILNDSI